MFQLMRSEYWIWPLTLVLLFSGCAKSSSTSDGASTKTALSLAMVANNAGTNASLRTSTSGLFRMPVVGALEASLSEFENSSIASGAPDELTISITKMALKTSTGGSVTFFEDSAGKEIAIKGSRVDLSDMFTTYDCLDNNGSTYSLKDGESCECGFDSENNPVGKVTISRTDSAGNTVSFQGCPWDDPASTVKRGVGVKAAAAQADVGTYTSIAVTFKRTAQVKGCVTGRFKSGAASGLHSYCTQTAKSFYNNTGGGTNSDFEGKSPETMDLDLSKSMPLDGDAQDLEFPIQGGLTLASGQNSSVTLVIDTNRLLRFYNQNENKEVNPGFDSTKSYFFTTLFDSSIYVFAGQPGSILGYQWITEACTNVETASIPSNYECASGNVVAGWLTVVTNSTGAPLAASFMPDDDNALTVIKGANRTANASTGGVEWDSSAFTQVSGNVYDIGYSLGTDGTGTMKNVDLGAALNSSVTGVTFRGLQKSHGTVTLTRKL